MVLGGAALEGEAGHTERQKRKHRGLGNDGNGVGSCIVDCRDALHHRGLGRIVSIRIEVTERAIRVGIATNSEGRKRDSG